MKTIAITLLAIVALTSCIETVDDIYLPKSDPKIQVSSFIAPNMPICAKINKVMPIEYNVEHQYDQPGSFCVENAEVTVTNTATNEAVVLVFDSESKTYTDSTLNFVKVNTQYQIQVDVEGFNPLSATTVVPSDEITTLNHQISTSNSNEYSYTCGLTISDKLNVENFYNIQTISHQSIGQYNSYAFRHASTLITDKGKDGQQIPFSISIETNPLDSVEIYVLSTDENYYKYHITIQANSDNIFSEPSPIFTNIENGLGIFASYTEKRIALKP